MTRAQAKLAGFSVSAMARAVDRGDWERLHPGIFLVDPRADLLRARMIAGVLRAPGRAWVSHRSAAHLWGLDVPVPLWPDVTTTANLRGGRGVIRSVEHLPRHHRATRDSIPVTTPERTLVDLGGTLPLAELESAVIHALRTGIAAHDRLLACVGEMDSPGRRGSGMIARILTGWSVGPAPESALEARLLRIIRRARLPEPVRQWEVRAGRRVARVDLAYPEQRVAIEADGYRWHSGAEAWRRDLARRNALTQAGWLGLHFTWDDVTSRRRADAATIRDALSRQTSRRVGRNDVRQALLEDV